MSALSALATGFALLASAVLLPIIALVAALGGTPPITGGGLPAADIPAVALDAYRSAAAACPGLSWTVLAAIGEVESDHGRSNLPGVHSGANAAGAEGPMQFLPATFAAYAVGAHPSVYDIGDASLAAARLLCANGAADPARLEQAIWNYNHSSSYVATVLAWAARYSAPAAGDVAAAWAVRQVGLPYQWGAAGPSSYDCSGLTLRAWEVAGIELPRVAADQYGAGVHVPIAEAQPGDLVFFEHRGLIDHVGLYLGAGMMVEAPHTGTNVRVAAVYVDGLVPLVTRP
jgi:cell wall-associated NlpC family hydrolase